MLLEGSMIDSCTPFPEVKAAEGWLCPRLVILLGPSGLEHDGEGCQGVLKQSKRVKSGG